MRTMLLIAMMAVGCVNAGDDYARAPDTGRDTGAAAQAVAGPAVTVAPRGAGQLAVSWRAVATAVQYQLFQSVGGGALAPLDTVTGAPPSTSYIADGLTSGVRYCYAVRAGFADGLTSDASAAACATIGDPGTGPAGQVIEFSPTLALPSPNTARMTYTTSPPKWDIGDTSALLACPLTLPVGSRITALQAHVRKGSGAGSRIEVHLVDTTIASGGIADTFLALDATSAPGFVDIGAVGLSVSIAPGHLYEMRVSETNTTPGPVTDFVNGWQVATAP